VDWCRLINDLLQMRDGMLFDLQSQITGVQNNRINLFEFYNFNSLGCKNAISILRLSLSALTGKRLAKDQRLKAQGIRRKEKHFNGDNSTFCLAPCARSHVSITCVLGNILFLSFHSNRFWIRLK
jgi:hypothetical protein